MNDLDKPLPPVEPSSILLDKTPNKAVVLSRDTPNNLAVGATNESEFEDAILTEAGARLAGINDRVLLQE